MTWLARANLLRVLRLLAVVSATSAVLAFLAAALPPLPSRLHCSRPRWPCAGAWRRPLPTKGRDRRLQ